MVNRIVLHNTLTCLVHHIPTTGSKSDIASYHTTFHPELLLSLDHWMKNQNKGMHRP